MPSWRKGRKAEEVGGPKDERRGWEKDKGSRTGPLLSGRHHRRARLSLESY